MIKETYSKGIRWVGIGFWGSLTSRVAILIIENLKNSSDLFILLSGLLALASIVFLLLLVYGSILILQAKNRHWAWVFLLLLNIVGLAIILWWLQDRSLTPVDTSGVPQQPNNKRKLSKLTPVFIAVAVVAIFIIKGVFGEKFDNYEKNLPVVGGNVTVSSSTLPWQKFSNSNYNFRMFYPCDPETKVDTYKTRSASSEDSNANLEFKTVGYMCETKNKTTFSVMAYMASDQSVDNNQETFLTVVRGVLGPDTKIEPVSSPSLKDGQYPAERFTFVTKQDSISVEQKMGGIVLTNHGFFIITVYGSDVNVTDANIFLNGFGITNK